MQKRDFESFDNEGVEVKIVDDVVSTDTSMGTEVDIENVENHTEELTTEEPVKLQNEHMNVIQEEHSSENDEDMEEASITLIKEICGKRSDVQAFIEKHHPNKTVTNRAVNILNENVMSHFWKIHQKSKRQISLHLFLLQNLGTN